LKTSQPSILEQKQGKLSSTPILTKSFHIQNQTMVSHTPQSALRSGKFGSRTHDDPDPNHNFISSGYNLQPLLDLTPSIQTKVHHAPLPSPTKSKTVAFPSKDQEVTLESYDEQQQARPRKKDKKSKWQTRGHGKSGCIQSRTGATPFVLQRWTNSYWLHVYPATLKIFESEEKMNQWKAMDLDEDYDSTSSEESIPEAGDSGCGSGKFKKGKHRLVLASINFDSQGTLKRKISMFESKKNGKGNDNTAPESSDVPESYNDGRYTKKTMVADEFANSGFPSKTFVMEEVRSKYYKRNGPLM
jgi:hypothetical protein